MDEGRYEILAVSQSPEHPEAVSGGDTGSFLTIVAQVWSLTQFYSVDFSKSRINVKKCVFNKRTIKVCVSCY